MSEAKRLDDTTIFDPNSEQITLTDEQTAEAVGYLALVADDEAKVVLTPESVKENPVIKKIKPTTRKARRTRSQVSSRDEDVDITRIFLTDIGKFPLLTAEEERELGFAIARGKEAQARIDTEDVAVLSLGERVGLRRAAENGREARTRFIESNYRLLVSVASRHPRRDVPLLDRIQEGYIGLEKAVDGYDPSLGFKFSSYATEKIKQAVHRGILNTGSVIRQPVHRLEPINEFMRARRNLEKEFGPEITDEKVCELIGWTHKDYEEMKRALIIRGNTSLQKPVNGNGGGAEVEKIDFIEDNSLEPVEEQAARTLLSDEVQKALDFLNDEEQRVLTMYYGLGGVERMTQADIGKHLGLTRERVRQIEGRAFSKLRHPIYGKQFGHLRDFLT